MAYLTAGQMLLADILPPDVYRPGEPIDKKSSARIHAELAKRYPERYKELSHKLLKLGREAAIATGGGSFGIDDLETPAAAKQLRQELQGKIREILETGDPKQRKAQISELLDAAREGDQKSVLEDSILRGNPLAKQLRGAGRGNPAGLARLIASDLMYADSAGKPTGLPVLRSYSQGLLPGEYIGSTFGARKGIVDTKLAVGDAGYLAKLLTAAAHRLVVTDLDGEGDEHPEQLRGLPTDVDDPDNVGALLAVDMGPYKRNTALTPKVIADLRKRGNRRLLVRSPLASSSPDGVYARDVGIQPSGRLPNIGESIGTRAGMDLSEPLTQGRLSSKHSGGLSTGSAKGLSGFDLVERLINSPKDFREAASHSEVDGRVQSIEKAPQGGSYITVAGQKYYAPEDAQLRVKVGDEVEAGDPLTEGIINPRIAVQHKGIGEGSRLLTEGLTDAFRKGGMGGNRRNVELLVKGLVNRVRVDDEFEDYAPGDLVPYGEIVRRWQPREGYRSASLEESAGKYLERPVLHYSLGTRITPSVKQNLQQFGIKRIDVHPDPPPFTPEMVRGADLLQSDPDWMTRQLGTGLQKGLLSATHRGAESDERGTSFVPARARIESFNRSGAIKIRPLGEGGLLP